MADAEQIRQQVREYILAEFLRGEDPSTLTDETRLAGGGILTSIDNIKLVAFLEETYGIAIEAHEVIGGPLDTVGDIVATVSSKIEKK